MDERAILSFSQSLVPSFQNSIGKYQNVSQRSIQSCIEPARDTPILYNACHYKCDNL